MPLRRLSTRHTRFFTCRCQRCAAEPDTSRGLPCPACWGASPHARSAATGLLPGLLRAEDVAVFGRDMAWDEPWARVALKGEGGRPEFGLAAFDPPEQGARRWEAHARLGFIYPDPMAEGEADPRAAAVAAAAATTAAPGSPTATGRAGGSGPGGPSPASAGAAEPLSSSADEAAARVAALSVAPVQAGSGAGSAVRPWACCTCGARFANDDAVLYGGAGATAALRERAAKVLALPGVPVRDMLPEVSISLLGLGSPTELAESVRSGELQVSPGGHIYGHTSLDAIHFNQRVGAKPYAWMRSVGLKTFDLVFRGQDKVSRPG